MILLKKVTKKKEKAKLKKIKKTKEKAEKDKIVQNIITRLWNPTFSPSLYNAAATVLTIDPSLFYLSKFTR